MKTILLGGLTALAVSTAPMVAHAADYMDSPLQGIAGDISIYGGTSWQNINEPEGTENYTGTPYGGLVRGSSWLNSSTNLQLEFSGEGWETTEHFNTMVLDSAVHLDWGSPDGFLFGVLGSLGENNDFSDPAIFGTVALELQQTWSAVTLYGQVGYSSSVDGGGADTDNSPLDGIYGQAAVRLALTPGINLGAEGGYAALTTDEKARNILRWGASIDGVIPNTPLGLFVKYQGHYDDVKESGDKNTVHAVLAGVTLFFNEESNSNMRVDYNPFTGVSNPRDAF